MNCKKGDLAVIVGSDIQANIGKLVTVKRFQTDAHFGPEWECEPLSPMQGFDELGKLEAPGLGLIDIPDSDLRPIRDQPGNETFVTEARNKLKGKTEISERGEVHS